MYVAVLMYIVLQLKSKTIVGSMWQLDRTATENQTHEFILNDIKTQSSIVVHHLLQIYIADIQANISAH